MSKIRMLELSGSYYDMGFAHGQAFREEIRYFTEDRVKLSMGKAWTGRALSREAVLALADACVAEHRAYAPELVNELEGMADATGLSLGELVINNGYTDFIDAVYRLGESVQQPEQTRRVADNCTAFLVPGSVTADGSAMFGQTWDMHDSATPHVILMRGKPDNAPEFLTFTITGCVGMIGMNEFGITVGINNMSGGDGQIGVTWPFVVRKILAQDNLDDALECLTSAKLVGAHNYLLMDKEGRGYNIEAMSTRNHIDVLEEQPLIHTNHCLIDHNREVERERPAESMAASKKRRSRAGELLARDDITPEVLMDVTRDPEAICVRSKPPLHVESSGAAIMRPGTGDFWAVWGAPADNEYEHFMI